MSVIFTKSSVSVTVNKNPSYDSDWYPTRLNQNTLEMADGAWVTYDNGPNIINGVLVLKNVTKAEGDALIGFIKSTIYFQLYTFTITPPSNTDIGAGVGTALTSCYFAGGSSLKGVFEYIAPGKYNIKFPYRKVA